MLKKFAFFSFSNSLHRQEPDGNLKNASLKFYSLNEKPFFPTPLLAPPHLFPISCFSTVLSICHQSYKKTENLISINRQRLASLLSNAKE